jgi:hypothetical protein
MPNPVDLEPQAKAVADANANPPYGATGTRLTADNHGFLRSTFPPDELTSWA